MDSRCECELETPTMRLAGKLPRHPQRQRAPAAAELEHALAVLPAARARGHGQRARLGLGEVGRAFGPPGAAVLAVRPERPGRRRRPALRSAARWPGRAAGASSASCSDRMKSSATTPNVRRPRRRWPPAAVRTAGGCPPEPGGPGRIRAPPMTGCQTPCLPRLKSIRIGTCVVGLLPARKCCEPVWGPAHTGEACSLRLLQHDTVAPRRTTMRKHKEGGFHAP